MTLCLAAIDEKHYSQNEQNLTENTSWNSAISQSVKPKTTLEIADFHIYCLVQCKDQTKRRYIYLRYIYDKYNLPKKSN